MLGRFEVAQELRERPGRKQLKVRCKISKEEAHLEVLEKDWLAENRLCSLQKSSSLKAAKLLQHQGFLRVLDSFQDERNFYIASEWADGGSIDHLIKKKGALKEHLVLWFTVQLVEAVAVAHSKGIYLGNLNNRDVFIKDSFLKIGLLDYCVFQSEATKSNIAANGSSQSLAPEVLRGASYSNKADMWSLGVVLFEMLYGTQPLVEPTLAGLRRAFDSFKFTSNESESNPSRRLLSSLLEGLLVVDPARRLALAELVSQMPKVKFLLDTHAIIGLKININAIEYYCDPILATVESVQVRRKLAPLQHLVDQHHQINQKFKTDPNVELKWTRLEFKWMTNLVKFTVKAFKEYKKVVDSQVIASLLSGCLALLSEYQRLVRRFAGSTDQMFELQRQSDQEKSLLLGLLVQVGKTAEPLEVKEALQRLLDTITDEIIAVEEDEAVLKAAALHANLVLDSMDLRKTVRMYFRLDRSFCEQPYLPQLMRLDFESLVEAMNCKVDHQNELVPE